MLGTRAMSLSRAPVENGGTTIFQRTTPIGVVVEWGSRTLRHACNREYPGSAMCVQNFDDSRGPAIRITYRISLRSSSLWEPRHPLLKVVLISIFEMGSTSIARHAQPTLFKFRFKVN